MKKQEDIYDKSFRISLDELFGDLRFGRGVSPEFIRQEIENGTDIMEIIDETPLTPEDYFRLYN